MLKKLKILSIIFSIGTIITLKTPYAYAGNTISFLSFKESMTKETAKAVIDKQIQIFINKAPDVFEIEHTLTESANPIIFAESMLEINRFFDKNPSAINQLIILNRKQGTKFKLSSFSKVTYTCLYHSMQGIEFNLDYYRLETEAFKEKIKTLYPNLDENDSDIITHPVRYKLNIINLELNSIDRFKSELTSYINKERKSIMHKYQNIIQRVDKKLVSPKGALESFKILDQKEKQLESLYENLL